MIHKFQRINKQNGQSWEQDFRTGFNIVVDWLIFRLSLRRSQLEPSPETLPRVCRFLVRLPSLQSDPPPHFKLSTGSPRPLAPSDPLSVCRRPGDDLRSLRGVREEGQHDIPHVHRERALDAALHRLLVPRSRRGRLRLAEGRDQPGNGEDGSGDDQQAAGHQGVDLRLGKLHLHAVQREPGVHDSPRA